MSNKKHFIITVTGEDAEKFHQSLNATLNELDCQPNSHIMGFGSKEVDGRLATLDMYAPSEQDERPYLQLTVWKNGEEYFSDVVDFGGDCIADTLVYDVNASGEPYTAPFSVDVAIASDAMIIETAEKILAEEGLRLFKDNKAWVLVNDGSSSGSGKRYATLGEIISSLNHTRLRCKANMQGESKFRWAYGFLNSPIIKDVLDGLTVEAVEKIPTLISVEYVGFTDGGKPFRSYAGSVCNLIDAYVLIAKLKKDSTVLSAWAKNGMGVIVRHEVFVNEYGNRVL